MQGKGGVGKSVLTQFIAEIDKSNERSLFLDMDTENQTSIKNLTKSLGSERVKLLSLLDEKSKDVKNEKLINLLETAIADEIFDSFYFDFGGRESSAFVNLTKSTNYSIDFIYQIAEEEQLEIEFIVIVGGDRTDYSACIDFANYLVDHSSKKDKIKIVLNSYSFSSNELLKVTENLFSEKGCKTFHLPSIDTERGNMMLSKIQNGTPLRLMDKPPYVEMINAVSEIIK